MDRSHSDLESVRKRPGMYVGDTRDGSGLVHMIWEVVANSLDEHLAGRCDRISVDIREDGAISVDDNGRGFPLHDVDGTSFVERALTSFHNTPTLDGHRPHEHVGMHGVGLFPVNALSSWLVLDVFSERRHYAQRFELGIPTTKMLDTGTAERSGTRITFAPDPSIFTNTWVDPGMVARRLRELSWLLPGLTLEFHDSRRHRFHQLDGLQGFLQANKPGTSETLLVDGSIGEIRVEAAARWHAYPWSTIESFANIERTTEGGTHVRGMLAGLAQGLRTAAPDACRHNRSKQLENVISQGLDAVVCIRLNDPKYGGPTRNRLVTPAAETAVKNCVSKAFATFVREHQSLLQRFVAALGVAG